MNDFEVPDFVAWTKEKPIQVRFIEYMPFDGNTWSDKKFISYTGIRCMLNIAHCARNDRCDKEEGVSN